MHKGRGSSENPPNRFHSFHKEPEGEDYAEEIPAPRTQFIIDHSQSIISSNDSPDIPYEYSINPYRGCEHGCAYCYARPTHEYLDFSSGLDFETRILCKQNAPELLRKKLSSHSWKPQPIAFSGVTDPYQPVEKRLEITRQCLAVLAEFRNPVMIVTKNHLVTRDLDILKELARWNAVSVAISLTTLDRELGRQLEPRASTPQRRLEAIQAIHQAGIPVGMLTAPIIPGLTDHEIPALLKAGAEAGAGWAYYEILRLPHAVKELFTQWLEHYYPEKKERVLNRIRAVREGKLSDANFHTRLSGTGLFAEQIGRLFEVSCQRLGLNKAHVALSSDSFRRPMSGQLELPL